MPDQNDYGLPQNSALPGAEDLPRPPASGGPAGLFDGPAAQPPLGAAHAPQPPLPGGSSAWQPAWPPFGRACSRVGLAFVLLMLCFILGQLAVMKLLDRFFPAVLNGPAGLWLCTDLPLYCLGAPLGWLVLRGLLKKLPPPARPARYARMTPGWAARLFCLGELLMISGSLVSRGIEALLEAGLGIPGDNSVAQALEGSSLWANLFFVVLVAAVGEELLFRELLFRALAPYGERPYILLSAMLFALFHGNLGQIPYAFFMGLLLAWLRCRAGRPQWGMLLHGALNLCGGVLPFLIMDSPLLNALWSYAILALCIAGGIYLVRLRRPRWLRNARPRQLPACGPLPPHPVRAALLNPGMLASLALSLSLVLIVILADAGVTM